MNGSQLPVVDLSNASAQDIKSMMAPKTPQPRKELRELQFDVVVSKVQLKGAQRVYKAAKEATKHPDAYFPRKSASEPRRLRPQFARLLDVALRDLQAFERNYQGFQQDYDVLSRERKYDRKSHDIRSMLMLQQITKRHELEVSSTRRRTLVESLRQEGLNRQQRIERLKATV